MIRRSAVLVPLAAVLVACQTATPRPQTTAAAAAPFASKTLACETARAQVDLLLESAHEAATGNQPDAARSCESAVYVALSHCLQAAADDPLIATYVARVLDDLAVISEIAESGVDGDLLADTADLEEAPPDPLPVSPDQLVAEREKAREASFDLPVVVNAEVASLIEFYSGSYRARFAAAMERAGRYLPYIREELRRARLPLDLAYLPFVESAFNPRARSRARAQGLWQFMAGTARLYGVHCDRLLDERNDPYLATRAAVAHLADLHAMFGDWELALAAYNSGPGRVQQALRRARGTTDDFWMLRRYLPRETRNYVPALWAVLVIAKNPAAYGFAPIVERAECLGRVKVAGALDLQVLAEHATIDVELLADINPALIHGMTPMGGSYQLAVPCGQEQRFATVIAAIPHDRRVRSFTHVVAPGDTLSAIARRYSSSIETVAAANGVRNPRSLRVGQTLVIPRQTGAAQNPTQATGRRSAGAAHLGKQATAVSGRPATQRAERYRVQHGDSLYAIARRFGLSVERLKGINGLTSNVIKPGQWLRLVAL
jgi:membrane-bound lytic murein transglycosylase D